MTVGLEKYIAVHHLLADATISENVEINSV